MHASILLGRYVSAKANGAGTTGTRWVDITEPTGNAVTLWIPAEDADAVAACGDLIAALDEHRRAAMERMAAQVKADLPDEVDLPDTTGYGRLGAAWAKQSKERIPEDAICEDPDLGTWAPGEIVEMFGS